MSEFKLTRRPLLERARMFGMGDEVEALMAIGGQVLSDEHTQRAQEYAAAHIVIPRAQYEALIAAANDLFDWANKYDDARCQCGDCVLRREALAALRAAGLDTEGKP